MRAGLTRTTVTGIARLRSSQTWVMPTFSPTIALVATFASLYWSVRRFVRHTDAPPGHRPERSARLVRSSVPRGATGHIICPTRPESRRSRRAGRGYQRYTPGPRRRKVAAGG